MLKALLAAVETTIERDVTSVLVSTHVTQEQDHWATISAYMLSALKELKVNRWDRALAKVAPTLLLELHFVSDCENEEVRYYLAVEYTKDSLVGQIWDGVCGVYDMIQTVSSSSSGYDAISACRKESENAEQCNAPLRRVLHELFKTSGHPKHQLDLSALLVSGEKGDDKNFLMALIQSLEDSHVNFTSADTSKLREYAPDLAFAGSRAMAEMEISRKRYKPDHRDEL